MKTFSIRASLLAAFVILVAVSGVGTGYANNSWGGYHWARTSNPFALKLGDNVASSWDQYLSQASTDWSDSAVLDTSVVLGSANPKNCRPTAGRVEVCDAKYGNTGWLGIAQIWLSGSHITQGAVKLNDTYYNTTKYDTPAWRQFVMCQEIGHTFGLAHQDETFDNANLGTCMDYTNAPGGGGSYGPSNEHPDQHDYAQLESIYTHLDSTTTVGSSTSRAPATGDMNSPNEWGKLVSRSANGKAATFERDLGHGEKVLTHVYYAD